MCWTPIARRASWFLEQAGALNTTSRAHLNRQTYRQACELFDLNRGTLQCAKLKAPANRGMPANLRRKPPSCDGMPPNLLGGVTQANFILI